MDADNETFDTEIQQARDGNSQNPVDTSQEPLEQSNLQQFSDPGVHDQSNYGASSFPKERIGEEGQGQEMQERGGPGLLVQTGQQLPGSSSSMMELEDEVGDTPIQRANPAA